MFNIKKKIPCYKEKNSSVVFIIYPEINWKKTVANGLCVSIFLKNIGWYLIVIGNLDNYECIIKIFTGKVENVTPIIFIKTKYNFWC